MKVIACIDADYRATEAVTAVVAIHDWADAAPALERVVRSADAPASYEPGAFYKRELPGILAALSAIVNVGVAVIDGYVWLGGTRPGLGARLHDALGGAFPVVGVAKTAFKDNDRAVLVHRGGSTRPLYVTAAGMDANDAAACVARMHGAHRLPTILKRADRLARES